MITVMHLVSTFQTKTDTKWLVRLLGKVNRQEFNLVVGAFYRNRGSNRSDEPVRDQLSQMNIETFCLDVPAVWNPRSIWNLCGKINQYNPDIIHTHLLRADLLGGLAGKIKGRKVISTVYAYGDYRRAIRRRWVDGLLDKLSTMWADQFIAVCETIRDDLVGRVGVEKKRINVIQTGMDPMEVDPSAIEKRRKQLKIDRDLSEGEKVVLVGARLSYEKGVDCFLRAVGELKQRGAGGLYLVAGSGPMEAELKALAEELGISDRVRFLGFAGDLEVLMGLADVVVMPSYAEGLPNVALETFAVRRPLVASRVGGLVDLSEMDKDAILFAEPKNEVDLADKIQAVMMDKMKADCLALAGRRIIEKQLSTENVARRYEELYRRTIGFDRGFRTRGRGPV